jgi:predicted DNA-binding transcriptional regulator AlpA
MRINKDYITLADYAEKKNKSLKTIYNWIKSGKLNPVKIGKHLYIKS